MGGEVVVARGAAFPWLCGHGEPQAVLGGGAYARCLGAHCAAVQTLAEGAGVGLPGHLALPVVEAALEGTETALTRRAALSWGSGRVGTHRGGAGDAAAVGGCGYSFATPYDEDDHAYHEAHS